MGAKIKASAKKRKQKPRSASKGKKEGAKEKRKSSAARSEPMSDAKVVTRKVTLVRVFEKKNVMMTADGAVDFVPPPDVDEEADIALGWRKPPEKKPEGGAGGGTPPASGH